MSLDYSILQTLDALDQLRHVAEYLAGQFRRDMTRSDAVAHLQARAIVSRVQAEVFWMAKKLVSRNEGKHGS